MYAYTGNGRRDRTKTMATGGNRSAGFTIVETLIVLAVSGTLAASAILLLNGKQNKTEFQVAANSMKLKLEQIINETANGYYPSNNDYTCDGSGSTVLIDTGSQAQGTNNTCIFLGKTLAFGTSTGDAQTYLVYPLVAKRYASGTTEVSSFTQAKPIALAPDSSAPSNNTHGIDYSTRSTLDNGLTLDHAQYLMSSGPPSTPKSYVVFAFADSLGQYTPIDAHGTLSSTTQSLNLYNYDLGWSLPDPTDTYTTVAKLNASNIDETHDITGVELCFASGGTNQSAQLTITGQGQLAVTLKVYENRNCS